MALIVEDGTGKVDSEVYADVTAADDYISKWYGSMADWDQAAVEAKERALRIGARYIDDKQYNGYRTNEDQALAWPRVELGWIDGQWIDSDEIPKKIEFANIEAALKHVQGESLFPDHQGTYISSESKTVGPIKKQFEYSGSKNPNKTFEVIERLVRPFIYKMGKQQKLSRSMG